jgi:hypothetical protein
MKRFAMWLLAVLCAIPALAGEGRVRRSGKPVPEQYVVVLNDDAVGRSEIAAEMSRRFGTRTKRVFSGFHGFSFYGTEKAAEAISRDPRVATVEENTYAELLQVPNTTTRAFPPGWAIDRTDQAAGVDGYGGPGCQTASGIHIYVMDTGINDVDGTHFGARLRDFYRANAAWSFRDQRSHGTAVASLAGGRLHGLARSATIDNVKIIDAATVEGTLDDVIDAITRIDVDHYNRNLNNASPRASVVNMSIYFPRGTTTWDDGELAALDTAITNSVRGCNSVAFNPTTGRDECTSFKSAPASYGIVYVVGAGNNGTAINGTPARMGDDAHGTITVGATMMLDEWTSDWRAVWGTLGSNTGPEVDIWAPGTDVDVLCHEAAGCTDATNLTRRESGTSVATPIVAGQVARLALSYYWYTSIELENQLEAGGTTTHPTTGQSIIRDVPGGIFMRYTPGKCRM